MEDLTGKQFGHYEIVAPLGEGGMAAVYKAYQPSMERYVAIKVLPRNMATSEEFLTRFRREAKMLAQLQHQNILPVFDYGESDDGYPYIVMPFVPSGTLAELIGGKRLPLSKIDRIMTQIGDALACAHKHGMIHRDIKPSNVLIDESGNCLLTDFGLARMVESSSKLTSSGTVMGTPAYMSPEQGSGYEIDHRSDIYSLGIILYEMITGRVPYNAETPIAIVFKHIQDPLPSIRKVDPSLPESIELVLLKALAKNPEDRYQTAEEFVNAFQAAITEMAGDARITQPTETKKSLPPTERKTVAKPIKEKRNVQAVKFIIGGVVLFCLSIGIGGMVLFMAMQKNLDNASITSTAPAALVNGQLPTKTMVVRATETLVPSPIPSPTKIDPVLIDSKGLTMVLVPAGNFTMGNTIEQSLMECRTLFPNDSGEKCKPEFYIDETPPHQVHLDTYYIDKYEVTNLAYKACVDVGVCKAPSQKNSRTHGNYFDNSEFANYPVIWVDWNMAKTYCAWRGARLPTEAEWEKAARGDTPITYPWGNSFEGSKANTCDLNCQENHASKNFNDGFADVAPVDAFPEGVSAYGIFNLAGNVSEWVSDWYAGGWYSLSGETISNPIGPQSGEKNVIRGGSWYRYPINLRVVTRSSKEPAYSANDVGFRCVLPAP